VDETDVNIVASPRAKRSHFLRASRAKDASISLEFMQLRTLFDLDERARPV
jgi:hypothetical protein